MIGRTSMRRASSQTRLSSMQASGSFLDIAFISFSTRYTRQNYFWVRLDSRSMTGLCGEACALERSDAPIRIGAQLGREGRPGTRARSIAVRSEAGSEARRRTHASATFEGAKPPASSSVDELTPQRGARGLPKRSPASRPRSSRGCAARTTARCVDCERARAPARAHSWPKATGHVLSVQ